MIPTKIPNFRIKCILKCTFVIFSDDYNDSIENYDYNIEKASAILKEAGYEKKDGYCGKGGDIKMDIIFTPIGYIQSPFKELEDIPRQSIYAKDKRATIEILSEYVEGIRDIEAGDYIILLFNFHKSKGYNLLQIPGGNKAPKHLNRPKGVFSTRSPHRPNAIGMSIVKVITVHNNMIEIEGVDMLDGTPVIDIKPYSPQLNPHSEETTDCGKTPKEG